MTQFLPYGHFKWRKFTNENLILRKILKTPIDNETGYYIECDLEYPIEIHDFFTDYPPAIDHMDINFDILSPYSKNIYKELYNRNKRQSVKKLVGNLITKKNYICHYRNLQYFLKIGMKISKINRILEFKQKPWLKNYVLQNIQARKNANSKFNKKYFKTKVNSLYGKFIQQQENLTNSYLIQNDSIDPTAYSGLHFIPFLCAQRTHKHAHSKNNNNNTMLQT